MKKSIEKFFACFLATLVCFIPTWLIIGAWGYLEPGTFWEKVVFLGVAGLFLGGGQIFLFILWAWLLFKLLVD